MKYLKKPIQILTLLAIAMVGLWFFAPWKTIAAYALDSVRLSAARNGVYIAYDRIETRGRFQPEFIVSGLQAEHPAAKLDLPTLRVKLLPLASLRTFGVAAQIQFDTATITTITRNTFELTGGSTRFIASRNAVALVDTRVAGNLDAKGDIHYDTRQKKITDSSLTFSVPDRLNAILSSPIFGRFLESPRQGEWRIRYHASSNR